MIDKINNGNVLLTYQKRSKKTRGNEQIESIKSITNLLLRKIEALEKDAPKTSIEPLTKGSNLYDVITSFEKNLIRDALRAANWSQKRAAQILGIKATTLNAKMKRYEINAKSFSNFSVK